MRPLCWLLLVRSLAAASLTSTTTEDGTWFRYDLTLTNDGPEPILYDLFLSLPVDSAMLDLVVMVPAGWGDAAGGLVFLGQDTTPGTSFIQWAADFSGTYDIPWGNSLAGFSFRSLAPIDFAAFAVNGGSNFSNTAFSVPEPTFTAPLGILLALLTILSGVKRP